MALNAYALQGSGMNLYSNQATGTMYSFFNVPIKHRIAVAFCRYLLIVSPHYTKTLSEEQCYRKQNIRKSHIAH